MKAQGTDSSDLSGSFRPAGHKGKISLSLFFSSFFLGFFILFLKRTKDTMVCKKAPGDIGHVRPQGASLGRTLSADH